MNTKLALKARDKTRPASLGPVATRISLIFVMYLATCTMHLAFAQIPQGFNYQAIARDVSGDPIINTALPVRLTIQSDSLGGTIFWQELHSSVTTNDLGLFTIVVGKGVKQPSSTVATFSDVGWTVTPKFIKTEVDYSGWKNMGSSRLWAVPYSMVAGDISGSVKKLTVTGETTDMEESLFEVKNKNGQTVFAVYNEGVRIYVDDGDAKGLKGGFAIGGLNPAKAGLQDLFIVSPDSIRAYINDAPAKPVKGGFAIGGFNEVKGSRSEYLGINASLSPEIINPSEPRILWYPLKEAFMAGRVLVTNPDSVGTNSLATGYESKAIGNWSQALGYQAIARGNYSTSVGKNSLSKGASSFALGNLAKAQGNDSYALGSGALASAAGSFAIGSAGVDSSGASVGNTIASGLGSFALGFGSVSSGEGSFSYGLGNQAVGPYSMSLGYLTRSDGWYATSMGHNTTSSGIYSTALGYFTLSSGIGSTSMGCGTTAAGLGSTALGWLNVVEPGTVGSLFNMGSLAAGVSTTAGNYASASFGDRSVASGHTSFATGSSTTAAGQTSATFGTLTVANGYGSIAAGYGSYANGIGAIATGYGTSANGLASTTTGYGTVADGDGAIAAGLGTVARPYASLVIGQYNVVSGTPNIWYGTEPVFVIGNGESDVARSNAMTVLKNGTARFSGPIYLNDNSTFAAVYVNNHQAIWHDGSYFSWGYGGDYNVFADKVSIGTVNDPGIYSLYVAGNAYTTGTWGSSDLRWKKNLSSINNSLNKVLQLKGVCFEWRTDEFPDAGFDAGEQIGLIAQDVEEVFPELVRTDINGYKAVAYDKFSAVLIEAIKEQQKLIEEKEQRINSLEHRLERIEALLENNYPR